MLFGQRLSSLIYFQQSLLSFSHPIMSPSIANTMRRFSRSNSARNSNQSSGSNTNPNQNNTTQQGPYTPPLGSHQTAPNGGAIGGSTGTGVRGNNSRPVSAASNSSFDFMNRPVSQGQHIQHSVPSSAMSGLSRTDQVVLRYFWEDKYADNGKRDLHFVSLH